jgi:DNA polymerase
MTKPQITFALDFETFYSKTCSITTLGPLGYFSHHEFDAYMVSVVGDNGYEFVGHPKDFEWDMLTGNIVLSHNASFDQTLYKYGITQGWWPSVEYAAWHCTADMAAYKGIPRNLAGAAKYALGIEPDKSTRDNMRGKRWETMTPEFQKEVSDYAIVDSELCLKLWQELSPDWPEHEREISRTNREALQRGIPIDLDELRDAKERVKQYLFDAESNIPWLGEKPTLSRKAFNEECRNMGIEPPASLAKTNAEAQDWIKKHGVKYKWIQAVSEWRRINSLLKKLEAIDNATMPDGRYYGNIMYFGAHTGRFSGGGGNFNLQNLPRKEMFGADLRKLIKAPEGKKLVVVDLSQIEVRTLLWLAGDRKMLDVVEKSADIYEAFAISFDMWKAEDGSLRDNDPDTRNLVKAIVLGAGFMAGPKAFASTYGYSEDDAADSIDLYRANMPKVVNYWKRIRKRIGKYDILKNPKAILKPYIEELPLRNMNYGIPEVAKGKYGYDEFTVTIIKHSKPVKVRIWQGLITENLAQGLARDIFADILVRLDKLKYKLLFHVHDEVILEVPEDGASETLEDVIRIMGSPPSWIPDIPLAAEGSVLTHYEK